MLFDAFVNEIKDKKLFTKDDFIVAAVSGGADSVCLLHLLYRLRKVWGFKLVCAHINHGIREEADADAAFVSDLCQKLDVDFILHKENVLRKAAEEKISIELAGREVRYNFLKKLGADVILTAHNKNDMAESVLLHLFRGCGLDGLCGIQAKREDGICRPLLCFSREQIEQYLYEKKLPWREDASNSDVKYIRNRIRHEILPQIKKINPSFLDSISRMTTILDEENQFLKKQTEDFSAVERKNDVILFSVPKLFSMPLPLQRRAVCSVTDTFTDAERVLELLRKPVGTLSTLTGGKFAERERDFISIYKPLAKKPKPALLPMHGELCWGSYRISVGKGDFVLPKEEYWVRTRQDGDFFYPEGIQGKKKIGDYFTDSKIPRRLRDAYPIIVCNDAIASVGTIRRSRLFSPKDNSILRIKIESI